MASATLTSPGQTFTLDGGFEALVQLSPDAMFVMADGRMVYANRAAIDLFGGTRLEDVIGLPLESFIHPDFLDRVRVRLAEVAQTGRTAPALEQKYVRLDGSVVEVEARSAPLIYQGKLIFQAIARDITARREAEGILQRSLALQRAISDDAMRARATLQLEKEILELIAVGRPLAEILDRTCVLTEALMHHRVRCSIVLLDHDGRRLRIGAAPSLPSAYSAAIDGLEIGATVGSCGTAIFRNEQVIVENIACDPLWQDYRALAAEHRLGACWSTPIRGSARQAIGAFALYSERPAAPTDEQLAIISDVTHLVGVAIQKEAVERSLQESEDRYRSVVTCLTEGILVQTRDGAIVASNPAAERILRIETGKLTGMKRGGYFRRVVSENGVDIPRHELPSQIVLRTGAPLLNLIVGVELPDGEMVWVEQNVLPIRRHGELEPSSVLISFTDISAEKHAQQQLRFMATHDALTGLPNRTFFGERLRHALEEARADADARLALLFLDLDYFKHINDSIGHEAGDRLLQSVSARLSTCVGEGDTLARLGGDEFVILTRAFRAAEDLARMCEAVQRAIAEPFVIDGNEYFLGVSIGVAVHPDDGEDGATLLRSADAAMYSAKEAGRNGYRFFTSALNARAQRRYLVEKNLRRALANDELQLYYQPKVDLRSGRVVGAEALLRWTHPEIGSISPAEFIPIAEDTGMIIPIGLWVLETACRQAAAWRAGLLPDMHIAVNLSARQFQDERLVTQVVDILQRTGLPPFALDLEITESLLMGDTDRLEPVFRTLTGMGVRFSIDDFGTGYSSLSYLQRFPIDNLKVDRSFIMGLPDNRDAVALAQAIIAMARALDMRVVAEGVETREQMNFLIGAGCNEMQGYHFSAPVSAADFGQLLGGARAAAS